VDETAVEGAHLRGFIAIQAKVTIAREGCAADHRFLEKEA
jgi:hypothetical protein